MTDLPYKNPHSPWPWITGIIILAGIIWFMLSHVFIPETRLTEWDKKYSDSAYRMPADTINEVREFISYTEVTNSPLTAKNYTEMGIIILQSALNFIADRVDSTNSNVRLFLDSLDRNIVKIDTSSENYLKELESALWTAVNTLESIQIINYPELTNNILELKKTERSISPGKSLNSQLHKIIQFYKETGNTLQLMNLLDTFSTNQSSL